MKDLKKEILNNFDFEKVHRVMEFLNWTWVTKKNGRKIPSVKKMKKRASLLIDEALKSLKKSEVTEYSAETGGFEAYAFYGEEGLEITLKFVVDEWSTYKGYKD